MVNQIIASAPGKLILFGEYAVLQGYPAIVAAINRRVTVTITLLSPSESFYIDAPAINIAAKHFLPDAEKGAVFQDPLSPQEAQKLHFFCACLGTFLRRSQATLPCFRLVIDTAPFFDQKAHQKLGLGSSAALSVALMGALSKLVTSTEFSREDIFLMAQEAHFVAQGKIGSGIDLAASTYGGILQYAIDPADRSILPSFDPLNMPKRLSLRFVWSGHSASTTSLVRQVNQYRQRDSEGWQIIFDKLGSLAKNSVEAFARGDCSAVLEIAERYYQCLRELDQSSGAAIVSGTHAAIYEIARKNDCIYKPSGAGGGDFGILFCDNSASAEQCSAEITKSGYPILPLAIENQGLNITVKKE